MTITNHPPPLGALGVIRLIEGEINMLQIRRKIKWKKEFEIIWSCKNAETQKAFDKFNEFLAAEKARKFVLLHKDGSRLQTLTSNL